MAHLTPDRLVDLAYDSTTAPTPEERQHLDHCGTCRTETDELAQIVADVRSAEPGTLDAPDPRVWTGIEQRIDAEVSIGQRRKRNRQRRWRTAVAACAGLVLGVAGTLVVDQVRNGDRPELVARTELVALPGEQGGGTAELVREDRSLMLRVHATFGGATTQDYHEVWLLNGDGRRMYALGVLPASGDASFWLPQALARTLDGYQTVDVSSEPDDGNAAHSQHSLVRGELP